MSNGRRRRRRQRPQAPRVVEPSRINQRFQPPEHAAFRPDFRLVGAYALLLVLAGAALLALLLSLPSTRFDGFIFALYVVYVVFTVANRLSTSVTIHRGRFIYQSWFGLQRRIITLSTVAAVRGRVLPAITAGGATMILQRADGRGIRVSLSLYSRGTMGRMLRAILAYNRDIELDRFWTNVLQQTGE